MKILALIEVPNHVCYRYRIAAFGNALADRGWTLEVLPLLTGNVQRLRNLRRAKDADVVILQRRLLPWWQLATLRAHSKVLVYDCDDAVFLRDSNSTREPLSQYRLAKFWATLQMSDAVIVGNRYLEKQTTKYVTSEKIHRVPTCLDVNRYPLAEHHRTGANTRMVWIGSQATLPSLDCIQPGLRQISKELPGIEFRLICDHFPSMSGVQIGKRVWSESSEGTDIAASDIGISWLPTHPWSLGKCGLKVLQYMAAGLPVIANSYGMHKHLVRHGKTGFLVDTPEEFSQAVKTLANDPDLRMNFGIAGRELVRKEFSLGRWSSRFVSVIEHLYWSHFAYPACDDHLHEPASTGFSLPSFLTPFTSMGRSMSR